MYFISISFSCSLTWITQKIPVTHVQLCHLLDYEHQLLSIVLSHCQYSLTYGHGQDIIYDLPALQKHIVGRFIHGKPLLILDNSYVLYQKNVHTAASFANIRKKVSPQVLCVCACTEYTCMKNVIVFVYCAEKLVTDQVESERATEYCDRATNKAEYTRLSGCGGDCNGVPRIWWTEGQDSS